MKREPSEEGQSRNLAGPYPMTNVKLRNISEDNGKSAIDHQNMRIKAHTQRGRNMNYSFDNSQTEIEKLKKKIILRDFRGD